MKKSIIFIFLLTLFTTSVNAQSSMTDDQIIQFAMKEREAGTSTQQIVIKLMQKGVDRQQLMRVRKKVERMQKEQGLGALSNSSDSSNGSADDRTRKNNAKQNNNNSKVSSYKIKDLDMQSTQNPVYDETNQEFMLMQQDLNSIMPDSTALFEQLMAEHQKNKRKVFGRDIFNNKELTFEPPMNIATPQNYRLGAGDAVYIDIYGASQKTIESTVSPDGTVTIEGYGPVQVAGMTVSQANAHLRSTLGSRYSSSQIRLTVGQTRTIMVNVMGEVRVPGTYTLSAFATVFNALYMAGGISDIGTLRNIKVYRNNKLISTVDVYDYILNGKQTGNVRLADNDMIVVGAYDCLVNLTGKVKRPMFYEMRKNESVGTLLKYAGGFTGDAYTKSVRVVRKTGREYSVYNVDEFDMSSFHVSDEDSVSVDSILPRFSNMAEIKGAVFRPGMYQVGGDISSVKSLIEHAEGVREEAFTAHAVMHRMKADRTLEVVPVDIDGIVKGTTPDIPLKPNDVLFVPTKKEMMQEQTITIHGEVNYPGIYKYADHETLEDFILQAGGLKETASTVKVDVARRLSDPKAFTTDTIIARTYTFALKDGFVIDGEEGFKLEPFDEVYVRKSPGYYKQQNVTVEGEVMFGGTYTLAKKNQRLSDIIAAAGGVNDRAYIKGARLERRRTQEERMRAESLLKLLNSQSGGKDTLDLRKLDIGDTYSVGIELDKALSHPGGDEDVVLREGDRIIVPQFTNTVKISGDVMYPNTVGFEQGKNTKYYVNQAGGYGNRARKSHAIIIYMNGKVAKVGRGVKPQPGCEIVVPSKPIRDGKTLAEILTIGTSVASIATMIATLANILK
ncbi:MAG: SLBB domain-containing protein [Prevotella sp.]|nr:SLBB domain-containing protein [Prevotella sp.]